MSSELVVMSDDVLEIVLEVDADAPVRVLRLGPPSPHAVAPPVSSQQPLVELLTVSEGRALTTNRFTNTALAERLRFSGIEHAVVDEWHEARIRQRDERTGLETVSVLRWSSGIPAVRSWTEVRNTGSTTQVLQMVSSFAAGCLLPENGSAADVVLWRARSEWCGESRWAATGLRGTQGFADINIARHGHNGRATLATTSRSTWSSGEFLPTGMLEDTRTGRTWGWQVEHNGAWHWEVDSRGEGADAVALVITGPNDNEHQWTVPLAPGESFTSVPVAIAVADGGHQDVLAALTRYRRVLRRLQPGDDGLPLIFNDYMNTLMGDPTTERLLPLVDAAAVAGAEIFVIDAGWYDDTGQWWDSVGEWEPSQRRFPDGGFHTVLDRIREHGMKPGLWLEPEVVGVRSPVADTLPPEAFLQRGGQRIVEHSRYHLDLRHPAARNHLDSVVDRLVDVEGARYFKLDYNVTPGAGTDVGGVSPGAGLLEHNRAHLAWLDAVLDRHPDVVFEACSSGAMRMDYAMLSRLQLQSTSDQQDPVRYATIAAAAPASLLPEQAGNWAYPEAGSGTEETVFALVNGLAGRMYLSGYLNRMDTEQIALVSEAAALHKALRGDLVRSLPFWPLGLPGWDDPQVALGLSSPNGSLLAVWQRADQAHPVRLPLPRYQGREVVVTQLFPAGLALWPYDFDVATGVLTLTPAGDGPSARLFRVSTSA
ncbi:MAG: glycoside hydrolase family 36 protein [Janthinobacterium lividum]